MSIVRLLLLFGFFAITACSFAQPALHKELSMYEESDNPKPLARFMFRNQSLSRSELEALLNWSLGHRWQFLKLVDHLRKDARSSFLQEFSQVVATSPSGDTFIERFSDSPSRSIQTIIASARKIRVSHE